LRTRSVRWSHVRLARLRLRLSLAVRLDLRLVRLPVAKRPVRSTWFRQSKAEAGPLPDNVVCLKPRGATTDSPTLDAASLSKRSSH